MKNILRCLGIDPRAGHTRRRIPLMSSKPAFWLATKKEFFQRISFVSHLRETLGMPQKQHLVFYGIFPPRVRKSADPKR